MAQRAHGDLLVVHVTGTEKRDEPAWIAGIRDLTSKLDGEFEVIRAEAPVDGVIGYAVRQHITQIVVGEPLKPRWKEILRGSFVNRLIRAASEIDIHVIARRER